MTFIVNRTDFVYQNTTKYFCQQIDTLESGKSKLTLLFSSASSYLRFYIEPWFYSHTQFLLPLTLCNPHHFYFIHLNNSQIHTYVERMKRTQNLWAVNPRLDHLNLSWDRQPRHFQFKTRNNNMMGKGWVSKEIEIFSSCMSIITFPI